MIRKIAVLGAGTMGPGIAQIMVLAGADVCLYDIAAPALERAKATLYTGLETFAGQKLIAQDEINSLYAKVSYTDNLAVALEHAELVVEAVIERKDVKEQLYHQLDELLPQDVIIASNTSFLNIFDYMPQRRLPKTIIAHWYSPPQMVPLVEVCPNENTEPDVVETVVTLLKKGGKNPVVMKKFIQGYIVNRLQMCLNQEVYFLLDNGYCTAEDIDIAVKSSFVPRAMVLGILQKTDFGGLNMTANNYRNKSYTMPSPIDMPKVLAEHLAKGETGVTAGKGFYDYTGKNLDELYAKRDEQLFAAYRLQKELMCDPL